MKTFFRNFYYSFPIQLVLLHLRKSQLLLVFWLIIFLTLTGNFMKLFGADSLFLAPEYLGNVNAGGAAIVGIAAGIFIMSWNITTFILHSTRFRFLATSSQPFLKYCINNSIIPLVFLIVYFWEALYFDLYKELIPLSKFLVISAGFVGGLLLLIIISFLYFFSADRRIIRTFKPAFLEMDENKIASSIQGSDLVNNFGLRVGYYLNTKFRFKKARPVGHYSQTFLDNIFKRHHFSAMVTVWLAFVFMLFLAMFLDHPIFQVPAGASILILFAILVAVMGALSYFLRSWSFLFMIFLFFLLNTLYQYKIIDPRNKAYGLDYSNNIRPEYSLQNLSSLKDSALVGASKENMISILNEWKKHQADDKPLLVLFNFSGGGLRGASFSMNVLQKLDSATRGEIMNRAFLMTGASGGMLAAAYFRELYRLKKHSAAINLQDQKYLTNISEDLLNPVFSSMISRDLFSPVQKFSYEGNRYVKDRGYAFEQKLNMNTGHLLDKNVGFFNEAEKTADIPLMILNSVITRDFKKLMISSQPLNFMMQADYTDSTSAMTGPDAIDFAALFKNEHPMNLRMLTALRMNATYPYVLPGVWLPSNPVIDVMDAGLRDNNGQETSIRLLQKCKDWINENTRGVMIIQVRSRQKGSWDNGYRNGAISELITKPFTMLQTNWFVLQDYIQDDEISYAQGFLKVPLKRVAFMYIPEKEQRSASLNFHLTATEKLEVHHSLDRKNNVETFNETMQILSTQSLPPAKNNSKKFTTK
jgi:hypothetical protein